MDGLMPTSEWIRGKLPSVYIPATLYTEPPDGWHAWMARVSGQPATNPQTISGRLVEHVAPAFAQWVAMKVALSDNHVSYNETTRQVLDLTKSKEAQRMREAFDAGQPIPVASLLSVERYISFVPVLRYDRDRGEYVVGEKRAFRASTHAEALSIAARWYDKVRGQEIERRKKRALEHAGKLPTIIVDLAVLQLEYDGLLLDEQGSPRALLNGAHGFYLVCAETWCYAEAMAATTAAKMALLGAAEDRKCLLLRPADLPAFVGLDGWQGDGEGGFRWLEGSVRVADRGWRVEVQGRHAAIVTVQGREVRVLAQRRVLARTQVLPEMSAGAVLAWAVWKAMEQSGRRLSGK